MSASPTPYSDAAVATPPSAAEVRSQAIAKLKRAASLPRQTNGRRPSQGTTPQPDLSLERNGSFSTPERHLDAEHPEEVLSPSPTVGTFDDSPYHPYMNGGASLQRSASASSSFHIPTPPHLAGYNQVGTPLSIPLSGDSPTREWSSAQLTPSYSAPLTVPVGHPVSGRNTPSPLPTLGELRTLQRSNSAAARARAMDKLTGGRETPAFEDQALDMTPTRPGLQRADSLGAPRMLAPAGAAVVKPALKADHPPVAFVDPKPRLQRSFTVGGSNMGEERRSAVGRRMVARLGERKQARETEENEVRQLWEERRAEVQPEQHAEQKEGSEDDREEEESESAEPERGYYENSTDEEEEEDYDEEDQAPVVPGLVRYSPTEPPYPGLGPRHRDGQLGIPVDDRPSSRTTQISEGDAFEYESHLRRSLSSRTARGAVGTVTEALPAGPSRQANHNDVEQLHYADTTQNGGGGAETPFYTPSTEAPFYDLQPPNLPYATPSRHVARGSDGTDSTYSPGGDSTLSGDGLQSMMFVMGTGGLDHGIKRETGGFPVDVSENGLSNWGTPAKDHESHHYNHPSTSSSISSPTPATHNPPPSAFDNTVTPLELSARSSVMSWEELGGDADREIPSDAQYSQHKKAGSMSSKVGRVVKGAMRKRSQSRSSTGSTTSVPRSPKSLGEALSVAVQSFSSRRGSASSVSPSQASVARSFVRGSPMSPQGEFVRHQPSVSSLAPSLLDESSANGLLLQHQLSNDPQPILEMPRAKMDDPRVFNSKLSPFPGIEPKKTVANGLAVPEQPRLLHQSSDSAVPTQQRVTPQVPDSIHSLPLPPPAQPQPQSQPPSQSSKRDRRGSDDSIGRKGWLAKAKAFGAGTSPRSSGGNTSRKSSITDQCHTSISRLSPEKKHAAFVDESDPFAAPRPPSVSRSRAVSPSVSTVAEGNEEGHRLTQFTVHRSANQTPVHPVIEEEGGAEATSKQETKRRSLPPRSLEMLGRMDEVLALGPDDPARPEILDDPPRKLLLATQVLQVVDANTVKDRYLLLFNDILAICKPIIESGPSANLDMRFVVKSIVSLDKLQPTGFTDDGSSPTSSREGLIKDFVHRFAEDPFAACSFLIGQSQWKDDLAGLARTLLRVPELDKTQLGLLLASETAILHVYLDTLNLRTVHIDEALRTLLLSLRLPSNPTSAERILTGFASRYYAANAHDVPYDLERTHSLVSGMMMLTDSIHDGAFGFGTHNPGLTVTVWIAAFGERDPDRLVGADLLRSIYTSIQRMPFQAPMGVEAEEEARPVRFSPEKLASRLTYNAWSEPMTISLPAADADLQVRLYGEGLEVEPAVLDFARSKEATFRVRGTSLGGKTLILSRVGRNAPLYPSLSIAKTFHVERAFMKHTFHLAFATPTGLKRRYCFSLPDAELRTKWGVLLPRQTAITRQKKSTPATTPGQKIRAAAEAVALLVLRDALISPSPSVRGRAERSGSVSAVYPKDQQRGEGARKGEFEKHEHGAGCGAGTRGFMGDTTGKEVVLVCRQNSVLPSMLELLQAGSETKDRGERF